MVRMHKDEVEVDAQLVGRLLSSQMPALAHLPVVVVEPWGTDNAIWRLGSDLVVRLPRIRWAAGQVAREAEWLPRLAPHLPVAIPEPVAIGEPTDDYPYRWAVHRWIPGEGAALNRIRRSRRVRVGPGRRRRDAPSGADGGRTAGKQSRPAAGELRRSDPMGHRPCEPLDRCPGCRRRVGGGVGSGATRLVLLFGCKGTWKATAWSKTDSSCGIVDWGSACAGDPAVDVQVVWSPLFTEDSRGSFLEALRVDAGTGCP